MGNLRTTVRRRRAVAIVYSTLAQVLSGSYSRRALATSAVFRAEIFLIENSILIDAKRHDARVGVCCRIGQERKAARDLAMDPIVLGAAGCVFSLPRQDPEVIALKRGTRK